MTPKHRSSQHHVSVGAFLEAGGARLSMQLVAGRAGLKRVILEGAINRPGLGLSGFFKHFAQRRVQVIGLAEQAYLSSMAANERAQRLREFFKQGIPCVVLTRDRGINRQLRELAEEFAVPVLRTKMITKHFVNGATIIMENLMAPTEIVQGTMVEIMGLGVLIDGKAGTGKSETALSLIRRGYALVADDVTRLRLDSGGGLMGSPSDITRYHMEIRGLGIIHVPSLYGVSSVRSLKRLDLVVSLVVARNGSVPSGEQGVGTREFLGVSVPHIMIPVAAGRDLANVVEAAALNEKLKRLGHDAEKELDEKLVALMTRGAGGGE